MRRFTVIFLPWMLGFATIVSGFCWYTIRSAPRWVTAKIEKVVTDQCHHTCSISVGQISYSIKNPNQVGLQTLTYQGGYPGASLYDIRIKEVTVNLSISALLRRQLLIHSLDVIDPEVDIIDGDKHSPDTPDSSQTSDTIYKVDSLRIKNGILNYTREHKKTRAVLHLAQIEAEVLPFGNTIGLKEEPIKLNASTQIEGSGSTTLSVLAYTDRTPQHIDAEINITNQNLAALSRFFEPNAGVKLEGTMLSCKGVALLRGQRLESKVSTTFKGLDITLQRHFDRSWLSAFVQNIGTAIDVNKDNVLKPIAARTRTVKLLRERSERPIPFILRGLKEAALKVARAD